MQWVYRLQQRIAITRGECNVILVLAFLSGLGLAARYVQSQAQPLPSVDYAEAELLFQQASEAPLAEAAEEAPLAPGAETTAETAPRPLVYTPKSAPPAASINLNTATASELQRLPRIGPKMAARILAYREAHGAFRRVQDLVQVRGIGTKTLAQLTPYLIIKAEEGN